MSNQIVISSGAKVRNLSGVLTGTAGIVNALGINVANGIPQLDGSGKILVSQLPNSVMEYKGTWNAATNTPTLVNGTGNQGDVYLCNVAGTVNFGAGPITFAVGDQAIYSGTIWQKAGGSTGTVTSVAVTETGDALTITGSPITTSGTINIGFAGTSGQYVNGAGGLTTFPSLAGYVTAVTGTAPVVSSGGTTPAISMPVATASVDGYLDNADWTTFNNKQNAITLTTTGTSGASTLVGSTLNIPNYSTDLSGYVPYTGATTNVNLGTHSLSAYDLIVNHTSGSGTAASITKGGSGEALTVVKSSGSGNAASITGGVTLLDELHLTTDLADAYIASAATWNAKQNAITLTTTGTSGAATLVGSTLNIPNYAPDLSGYVTLNTTQTITGTKVLQNGAVVPSLGSGNQLSIFVNTSNIQLGSGTTNRLGFNNSNDIYFNKGLTPSGTDTNGGVISFNNSASRTYTLPDATGTFAFTSDLHNPVTIGTANGLSLSTQVLSLALASTSATGALSSTDWNTFNGKQNALTNPITGTGTTNYVPKFTASGTIGNSLIYDNGTNIGIGTATPTNISGYGGLTINGTNGAFAYWNINGTDTGRIITDSASMYFDNVSTGALVFRTTSGSSERMRISNGGNVGIGTSSPGARLQIGNYTELANTDIQFAASTTGYSSILFGDGTSGSDTYRGYIQYQHNGDYMLLATASTERMRITSGGEVLIGTTSAFSVGVTATPNGQIGTTTTGLENMQFWNQATSGNNIFATFYTEGGGGAFRGSIDYFRAGGVVRYNSTSDANLKNIIRESDKQKSIDILKSTKIREYSWIDDESNKIQIGVIAQELYETYKGAVSKGSDDELFGTKDYKTWGVDKTAFTFHLIAGWQKHEQIINDLQAQIEELKAKIK
jgi:hypothetical protein